MSFICEYFITLILHFEQDLRYFFIPFHHTSLLDSADFAGNDVPMQEVTNSNDNAEEIVNNISGTVSSTVESATTSSASANC